MSIGLISILFFVFISHRPIHLIKAEYCVHYYYFVFTYFSTPPISFHILLLAFDISTLHAASNLTSTGTLHIISILISSCLLPCDVIYIPPSVACLGGFSCWLTMCSFKLGSLDIGLNLANFACRGTFRGRH